MNEYALLSIAGFVTVGLMGWAAVWLQERSALPQDDRDEEKPRTEQVVVPDDPAPRSMAVEVRNAHVEATGWHMDTGIVAVCYPSAAVQTGQPMRFSGQTGQPMRFSGITGQASQLTQRPSRKVSDPRAVARSTHDR